MIIHSSSVLYNDQVILFTGKSGDGKSTISEMINSEVFQRLEEDKNDIIFKNDKYCCSNDGQVYPLKAIFFLKKQEPNLQDCSIKPLGNGKDTFMRFIEANYYFLTKSENQKVYFSNIVDMVKKIPFYEITFTLDAEKIRDCLRKSL